MKIHAPDGRVIDANDVNFEVIKESWNEYKLSDGSTLCIKVVLQDILRTEDYDPMTGNPNYIVKTLNVVKVTVLDNLRKFPTIKKSSGEEVG